MAVKITITVENSNPETIWNKLAARLGREPTRKEAADEVRRILREASAASESDAFEAVALTPQGREVVLGRFTVSEKRDADASYAAAEAICELARRTSRGRWRGAFVREVPARLSIGR